MRPFLGPIWLIAGLLVGCAGSRLPEGSPAGGPSAPEAHLDTVRAGRFDTGKMWTFDDPPVEYFAQRYGFRPTEEWLRHVRMAALRFATYCSASFVSPDGLVMTNHHCARDAAAAVSRPGENLVQNGFYARTLEEERRVPNLFVDQLVLIEDVTRRIERAMAGARTDEERLRAQEAEIRAIEEEYRQRTGLEIQVVSFYNGARFSVYGYKRYRDVRLVFLPELELGYFGGDPDNFTYPRYAFDCAFFRVYDEQGQPLRTEHFFRFNPRGAEEGEPVFVVGNPGRTSRLNTVAQLEFRRDLALPYTLEYLKRRSAILQGVLRRLGEPNPELENQLFSIENTIKAFTGQLRGLRDPYLMARKRAFERDFRRAVEANPTLRSRYGGIWEEIARIRMELRRYYPDLFVFQTQGIGRSQTLALAQAMAAYAHQIQANASTAEIENRRSRIRNWPAPSDRELEANWLEAHLEEARRILGPEDPYVRAALGDRSPQEAARALLSRSRIWDRSYRDSLLEAGSEAILRASDPALLLGRLAEPRLRAAQEANARLASREQVLAGELARALFEVYGSQIPPDATFTLRLADGVVRGYPYNGTLAPHKTTFYGLYDRFRSFDQKAPWSLPERWHHPPPEFDLGTPLNFVSTNDIIGGNSGSPVINRQAEVVGLIFDGNIESLPGEFIYTEETSRAVSVHAGGIIAALRHIYQAERLVRELLGENPGR
nr:MAG: dipeptidyl-peptidase [Bacteroidota bacterium]